MAALPEPRIFVVTEVHEVKVKARGPEEAAWYAKLLFNPNRRLNGPIEMYLVGSVQIHDLVVKIAERDSHPKDQTVCRHDIRYDQHCRQCEIQGYCGCPECIEKA